MFSSSLIREALNNSQFKFSLSYQFKQAVLAPPFNSNFLLIGCRNFNQQVYEAVEVK